jgi:tripartite-type tricarboxylate transporter receptor subunit TctC
VVPSTMANPPLNVRADLTAVGALANVPLVLVVQPAKRYQAIHEFVAAAKARPGGMTYGSGGRGDATHLAAERFRLAAGLEGLYVPTARLLHGSDISSHAATRGQTASGVGGRKRDPRLGTT